MAYLSSGVLPEEKSADRKIKHKALNYQMNDGVLYQHSFFGPLLRCVDAEDVNYLIREVHEGICGLHAGPRMVVAKLMNVGYYWPGMHLDVVWEIKKCDSCQRHAPNTLRPKNELVPVTSAWPFQKWPIDIMVPFPKPRDVSNFYSWPLITSQSGWKPNQSHPLWHRVSRNSSGNS
ncbi:uncharacterized protein LOC143578096 [Bidens hawaiensis]|uniref:uncharacterized protein LOC143578096 n=1 Tax=Bidens hawaiensis TaxID=980011 RepID=UPI004049AFEB